MLSESRLKELRAIVKKTYPDWFPNTHAQDDPGRDPSAKFPANSMRGLPIISRIFGGCCGAGQLDIPFRDVNGLYNIGDWTELQKAMYALFLHNPKSFQGILMACSTNTSPNELNGVEKTLQFCGFHPIVKAMNKAHGPRYLTVWILNTGEKGIKVDGVEWLTSLYGQDVDEPQAIPPQAKPLPPVSPVKPVKVANYARKPVSFAERRRREALRSRRG